MGGQHAAVGMNKGMVTLAHAALTGIAGQLPPGFHHMAHATGHAGMAE